MSEVSIFELFPHIHTGREMELMLEGVKPLSVFSDSTDVLPDEVIIPEKAFSTHVRNGTFIRYEFDLISNRKDGCGKTVIIRHVLFSSPAQYWRIQAYELLKSEFNRTGIWNETCERMEGKLLGYTDLENDLWCRWLGSKKS